MTSHARVELNRVKARVMKGGVNVGVGGGDECARLSISELQPASQIQFYPQGSAVVSEWQG